MSTKQFIVTMIVILAVGAYGIHWAATSVHTPAAKMRAEVEKVKAECIVIGDAADYNYTQGHFMRTIYKCPDDGTIKIR